MRVKGTCTFFDFCTENNENEKMYKCTIFWSESNFDDDVDVPSHNAS